jgi:deazaflavin-dependent oxidoreductase (nitroreductase family)
MAFIHPITRHLVNPVTRRVGGRVPGMGILTVVGRSSGRTYRIPMVVFRREHSYLFGLTYGDDVQWVHNVLATGQAELRTMGKDIRLGEPRRIHDEKASLMRRPARQFMHLMRVTEYVEMEIV